MAAVKRDIEAKMSRLTEILEVIEMLDYTDPTGKAFVDSTTFAELTTMAQEMDAMIAQPPALIEKPPSLPVRPQMVVSDVAGVAIGWASCGKCSRYLSRCTCDVPTEPAYIVKMRERELAAQGIPTIPVAEPTIHEAAGVEPANQPATVTAVAEEEEVDRCGKCGNEVSPETADESDDGSLLCHACQEASI